MKQSCKYDIFISYRRDGGEYTAKVIRDRLNEMGYRIFFDVESLRSGDFNTKLYSVIDECRDFLIVLSPNALDRCWEPEDWVRQEIVRALDKDKNIIPIFLRGFYFPKELPAPIEPLRFKNGVNANTEFFEAFMDKLLSFLSTKAPMRSRRWIRKAVAMLLILCVAVFGAVTLSRYMNAMQIPVYPKTSAEKDLTADLIYYLETCLTQYDIMAGAADDSLDAFRRYVSTGAKDSTSMLNQLEVSLHTLSNVNPDTLVAPEDMLVRLPDSPFPSNEVRGLEDIMLSFGSDWYGYLTKLQGVVDGTVPMPDDDKLKLVECYEVILEEDEKYNAYCANELLLPVTNEDALHEFLYSRMSELTHVPLSPANWSGDKDALLSAQDECYKKIQAALTEMSTLVGNTNMEVNRIKSELSDTSGGSLSGAEDMSEFPASLFYNICTMSGLGEDDAVKVTRQMMENPYEMDSFWYSDENRGSPPKKSDSLDTLWDKFRQCTYNCDPVGGCICTLAIGIKATEESDPDASTYTISMYYFLERMAETREDRGLLVKSYYESDGDNPVLNIGDIIIAFDGKPCTTYEDYLERKSSLADGALYTLIVLRFDGEELVETELILTEDMPRVVLDTLNSN